VRTSQSHGAVPGPRHFQAGCPTTGAVTGGHEPGILDRANAAFNATSDALAARFRQVGLAPDDATRRATLLMYAAEGAVILARARRSVEPLTFIAEQLSGSRSEASPGTTADAEPGKRAIRSR
jgi:hypothetical protein